MLINHGNHNTEPPRQSSPNLTSGRECYRTSTVENGFRIKVRELIAGLDPELIGKKRPTGYNNAAYHIKRHAMAWVEGFPGRWPALDAWENSTLTRAERAILATIWWRWDVTKGYVAISLEDLGDAAANPTRRKTAPRADAFHRDTVHKGVKKLERLGLIQIRSGRGGIQNRRNLANQYTPNAWMFLDPFADQFVAPEYGLDRYEWRTIAKYYRARISGKNPTALSMVDKGLRVDSSDPTRSKNREPQESAENAENPTTLPRVDKGLRGNGRNPTTLSPPNPQNTAEAQSENPTLYAYAGKSGDGSPASPASPNGSQLAAPAPTVEYEGWVINTRHLLNKAYDLGCRKAMNKFLFNDDPKTVIEENDFDGVSHCFEVVRIEHKRHGRPKNDPKDIPNLLELTTNWYGEYKIVGRGEPRPERCGPNLFVWVH